MSRDEQGPESIEARLDGLAYGEQGITRNDMRVQMPDLPDIVYLHLPDSKRFRSTAEILHEVQTSAARAAGEFIGADDNVGSAEEDFGPAGYGDSSLINSGVTGSGNRPIMGFDGNSLETEEEYAGSDER